MESLDPAEPAEARRAVAFAQLPDDTRADVRELAERGELHPDPMVAASSLDFARRITAVRGTAGFVVGLALSATAGVLGDIGVALNVTEQFAQRRVARQLLRVAAETGWQPPPWATVSTDRSFKVRATDLIRRETEATVDPEPDGVS